MTEYMVDAFILKSVKAMEADRVITLYTRQMGKIRVMAHGAEKPTSRKRGAVQPFSFSRLLLRKGKDLDSVSQGEGVELFPALRQSLDGLAMASYLVELVDALTPDEDPNPDVFKLLLDTFRILGLGYDSVVMRSFEIKIISLLGYRPCLDSCVVCGSTELERVYFVPAQGGIVCAGCRSVLGQAVEISRGSLENLKTLMRWDTGRTHQLKITPLAGKEMKNVMRKFIEYHLERGMKSLKFEDLLSKYQV